MSTGFSSNHFSIHEISEDVYAAMHSDGGWQICNSGILDLGEATLVFDTGLTPQAARNLKNASVHLTGREPTIIVNSHYHNDHIRGNQSFPESLIISSSQIRNLIDLKGREELESDRKHAEQQLKNISELGKSQNPEDIAFVELFQPYWEGIITSLPSLELKLPELTFTEKLTLHGSYHTAIITSFSKGHTDNDLILYLPEDNVVFCGDLLFAGCHPYLGDGYPDSWFMILNQIEEVNAEILIPGHGHIGSPEDLSLMIEYIGSLMENVRIVIEEGGSADDAAKVPVPESFKDWILDRSFYSTNMRFLYKQLSSN